MIKGAVMDVDGVILDSAWVWEDLGPRYLEGLGIKYASDLSEKVFYMTVEESAAYMAETYDIDKDPEDMSREMTGLLRDFYENEASLKAGVTEYIEGFRDLDIPVVIATSGERRNMEAALDRLGVLRFFTESLTCRDVGAGKDSPLIYLEAARIIGEEPKDIVVLEDSMQGIMTAGKAGFITAGVFDQLEEKNKAAMERAADIYIRDFRDPGFGDFIKALQGRI